MDEARPPQPDGVAAPRPTDLQLQFEQVSVALTQLRQTHERLHEMETQLAEMTRDCAGILDRWAKTDERHASAVIELHSRLSEWNDLERKLLNESATRIHQFERSLQHEWSALRQKHEEPIQRLDAEAARITETCLTAIDAALKGFDRAEAKLGALEQQMYREMESLTREVREALAELRQGPPQLNARRPWSLDNVVRLHNELRSDAEAPETAPALALGSGAAPAAAIARVPIAGALAAATREPAADHAPIEVKPAEPTAPVTEPAHIEPPAEAPPLWRRPAVLIGVLLVAAVAYGIYWRSQVDAALRDAAVRAEASERLAAETRDLARQQMQAMEKTADARISTAEQAAQSAQALTMILAAPDLRRFDLVGGPRTPDSLAQVLWSRAQGAAITVSRLPAPPEGRTYQLWLLTAGRATSAGVFLPDASGRVSVVLESPAISGRVLGAVVTQEPAAGSAQPSGRVVLRVAPAEAAPSAPAPGTPPATP